MAAFGQSRVAADDFTAKTDTTLPHEATAEDATQTEEAQKNAQKRLSEILAEIFQMESADAFNAFQFPEDIQASARDVLDEFEVVRVGKSRSKLIFNEPMATVKSAASGDTEIRVSRSYVRSDMSKLDTDGKSSAALEMAIIAANNPALMETEGGIPLEGNDEEKLALYLAAQKLGFEDRINQKSLEGLQLSEEQQHKIMQSIETAWNTRKITLNNTKPEAEAEQDTTADAQYTTIAEDETETGAPQETVTEETKADAEVEPEKTAADTNTSDAAQQSRDTDNDADNKNSLAAYKTGQDDFTSAATGNDGATNMENAESTADAATSPAKNEDTGAEKTDKSGTENEHDSATRAATKPVSPPRATNMPGSFN